MDVLTGKNGGLTVAGVLWGFRDRQELEGAGADYVIARPEELLRPGIDQQRQARRKAAQGEDVAKTSSVVRCALCWLATAFFGLLELADLWRFFALLPDVLRYGYDWEAGYNLRLAEDFEIARALAVFLGVPLLFLLPLSILCTRALPKRSRLTVGCAVGWPVAAVLALFEYANGVYLVERIPKLIGHSVEPYLVENCREAAVMMAVAGVPFLLALALAVYCTANIRKRGKNREHAMPDRW